MTQHPPASTSPGSIASSPGSIRPGLEPQPATLEELARLTGGSLRGGAAATAIRGVATIEVAGPDQLTWVVDANTARRLSDCRAGAVLTSTAFVERMSGDLVTGGAGKEGAGSAGVSPLAIIAVKDVEAALVAVLTRFEVQHARPVPGIHPTALVGANVQLGEDVAIGPHAVIGDGCRIGARARLHAGVYLGAAAILGDDCNLWPQVYVADRTQIGHRVTIKPGAVIGSDGFGFIFRERCHQRVPQIGTVRIEDDVEIGANACVDRAKVGVTVIGRGTKIDNLVQVAHNCVLGPLCILAGQVGIAGGVCLGTGVYMGGQAGAVNGLTLGDTARIGAQALVTRDIEPGAEYSGAPARPHRQELRDRASLRRVAELLETVRELSLRVTELEAAMHDRKAR